MKSDVEWKYWGAADPLWSVAAWKGKQAGAATAWTATEFLRLGEQDFADIWRHWKHYGVVDGRCVEIGCGAGRMTKQLATRFRSVLAVDVSSGQLAKAKELLGSSVTNVEFRLVESPLVPAEDDSCAAMFSSHVFQHFSSPNGIVHYLKESHRVIRSGGSICFHLPVPGAHLTTRQSLTWLWLRNQYRKLKRALRMPRIMEYHRYKTKDVFDVLAQTGFAEAELRVFAMHSNGDYHSFFLARKP